MLDANVSRLIARIYADAGDSDALALLIDEVAERTGSSTAMLAIADTTGGSHSAVTFHGRMTARRADVFAEYAEWRYADDPSFGFVQRNPNRGLLDSARDLTDPSYVGGDFHRWLGDAGVSHWLLRYGRDPRATFAISLHSGTDGGPHDDTEAALFALLFPHFENAVRIATRPPLIDVSEDALVLVGAEGRLRAANAAAERLLGARDGITLHQGCVCPVAARDRAAWAALLHGALDPAGTGGCGGAMPLARRDGAPPLIAVIEPMPPQSGLASMMCGALVRLTDPRAAASPRATDRWRKIWGLTAAETRAAAALYECGCDLRAAGELLGVTYATMRTHVAALLIKTGASGQPELMRRLAHLSG